MGASQEPREGLVSGRNEHDVPKGKSLNVEGLPFGIS